MNISLTPELEKFVQSKLNHGLYTAASEIICESLRIYHFMMSFTKDRLNNDKAPLKQGDGRLKERKKFWMLRFISALEKKFFSKMNR